MITPHFMSAVGPSHGIEKRWGQPASFETFQTSVLYAGVTRESRVSSLGESPVEIARGWTVPFPPATDPTRVVDGPLSVGALWFAYGEQAAC